MPYVALTFPGAGRIFDRHPTGRRKGEPMSPEKPSEKEEEYFARQEFERKKKLAEERERKLKEEERARLKELHWMHCPKCGKKMKEIKLKDISIDECPACLGVFFDGGELDLLLEKTVSEQKGFFRKLAKTVVAGL